VTGKMKKKIIADFHVLGIYMALQKAPQKASSAPCSSCSVLRLLRDSIKAQSSDKARKKLLKTPFHTT
jgi:hypothetical protein